MASMRLAMTSMRLVMPLITVFISRVLAVAPIQGRTESQLLPKITQINADASNSVASAHHYEDMLGSVMRREASDNNAGTATETRIPGFPVEGLKQAALAQRDSKLVVANRANRSSQDVTHPGTHAKGSKPQIAVAPPESFFEAISRELSKIPEGQKPTYVAAFLMLFGSSGFLFYVCLTVSFGKEDRKSAIRKKIMNIRAPGAVAQQGGKGCIPGSTGSWTGQAGVLPKGHFKGKGKCKPVGKGSFTGAGRSETSLQSLSLNVSELNIGQRSKGPGSVSSTASSHTSTSVSRSLAARSSASTWTSPEETARSSDLKVYGGCKEGKSSVHDLLEMLRGVQMIQTAWRSWKAAQKLPRDGQRITFLCDVLEGLNMPNVNRFGGCDPYVECRIVKNDPRNHIRGDLDMLPLLSAQTDVRRNDMAPRWRQRLLLSGLTYEKGLFMQLALWDYNSSRSQPIGHVTMPIERALTSHGSRRPVRAVEMHALPGVEVFDLRAKVSVQCSYREAHKYRLIIASGSSLPKAVPSSSAVPTTKLASNLSLPHEVEQPKTMNSYVEARILSEDPRKAVLPTCPNKSPQLLWSDKTDAHGDNDDPVWNQEFEFTLDQSHESVWLQLLLWDANSTLSNTPVGHAVMKMPDAQVETLGTSGNLDLVDYTLQLEDMPKSHSLAALSLSALVVRIGYELAISAGGTTPGAQMAH